MNRVAVFVFACCFALHASDNQRSVFIRAQCDGKASTSVLSSLKEAVSTSARYRLVSGMNNEGRLGAVLAIYVVCAERPGFAAIATTYGTGTCSRATNCQLLIEGTSLKLALCDSKATAECGRRLFETFNTYVNKPPSLSNSQ